MQEVLNLLNVSVSFLNNYDMQASEMGTGVVGFEGAGTRVKVIESSNIPSRELKGHVLRRGRKGGRQTYC
eukprot:2925365-Pyramimonas_sp.AAC.1